MWRLTAAAATRAADLGLLGDLIVRLGRAASRLTGCRVDQSVSSVSEKTSFLCRPLKSLTRSVLLLLSDTQRDHLVFKTLVRRQYPRLKFFIDGLVKGHTLRNASMRAACSVFSSTMRAPSTVSVTVPEPTKPLQTCALHLYAPKTAALSRRMSKFRGEKFEPRSLPPAL